MGHRAIGTDAFPVKVRPQSPVSALWLGLIQDIALAHLARLLADGLERRCRLKAGDRARQVLVLRVAAPRGSLLP